MKPLKKIKWPPNAVAIFMDHTGKAYFVYSRLKRYEEDFKAEFLKECHPNTFELDSFRMGNDGIKFTIDSRSSKNKKMNNYWVASDWKNSVITKNSLRDKLDEILK